MVKTQLSPTPNHKSEDQPHVGAGFGNASRSWAASDFSEGNLPASLDGVSVMINGKPAYVQYISPTQINAIAQDDDTIGHVQVQVMTP